MKQIIYLCLILCLISCNARESKKKGKTDESEATKNKQTEEAIPGLPNDKKSDIRVPSNISENYDCIDDGTGVSKGIDFLNKVKNKTLDVVGVPVTDADINKFGEDSYDELKNDPKIKFVSSGEKLDGLRKILKSLLAKRKNPTKVNYSIYQINSDEVNGFTTGGYIYIYTGLINYVKSESELAFVIGHEIGHNEKGHIRRLIQQIKTADNIVKDMGSIATAVEKVTAPSFNQQNEVEADFYGADLSSAAGYNPCKGIQMWKRMSKKEGQYDKLKNFLRSHPYSEVRFTCLKSHIHDNYHIDCE